MTDRSKKFTNKGGRPRKDVSIVQLRKLAELQCTYEEAAAVMGVSVATMKRRMAEPKYREAWDEGRCKGKMSLRRKQFALATKNAAMAIFLGKQWLGQRDVVANEYSGPGGRPIAVSAAKQTFLDRINSIRERSQIDEPNREPDHNSEVTQRSPQ